MSVLYPLTLRRGCTHLNIKANVVLRFFLLLNIIFSFQASFAQDEKEIQQRKDAEVKKPEQARFIEKLKANPELAAGIKLSPEMKKMIDNVPEEIQKLISQQKQAADEAKILAERRNPTVAGIEYKIITTGAQVEYLITNAGREIYRQAVINTGTIYNKQVQAEKEAIYASNILRANPNYPASALQSEIRALTNTSIQVTFQSNRTQRIAADYTFNGGGGNIPGSGTGTGTGAPADPYPATITVSGVPAGALVKEITINGLSHTFPDDIDIVLQSPTGTNVILMSDCGLSNDLVNVNYTFSDAAAIGLDDNSFSPSGTYKPTNFGTGDNWPAPGPLTAPSVVTLSTFGNGNHNGTWNLFIVDDAGIDIGSWTSWSITFTDPPAVCFPIVITGQPTNTSICAGASGSFTVAAGPNGINYNWQVNTGSGFAYLTNGGVYSGVNTATLNITGATTSMNGYEYRVVITCSQGGLPEISNPATLTVNVSPASPGLTPTTASICPGGSVALNTTASTIASSGAINVAIPDASTTGATHTINVSGYPALPVAGIKITFNITHTWDGDLEINLVAPNGNILNLVNNRGGSGDNFVNTVIYSSAATAISTGTAPFTGTYLPDAATGQGPTGFISNVTLFSDLYSVPNGNWTLAIRDAASGDLGTLTSWSIEIIPSGGVAPAVVWSPATGLYNDAGLTSPYVAGNYQATVYASPAVTTTYSASSTNGTCNSIPTNVTVTVNQVPTINTLNATPNACVGAVKTFSVNATGTGLTYQWQVNPGSGFVNITSGSPTNPSGFLYSGQTTNTLNINTVMTTMNNYKYRVVVSGVCTPAATSSDITLAVDSLSISVTSSSQCSPTTLTATGADSYSWSPSTGLSASTGATVTANPTVNTIYTVTGTSATSGCKNTTQVDVKFTPATPVVSPAAPIICEGTIQALTVAPPPPGVTSSSGPISVVIPDDDAVVGANHALTVSGFAGTVQSISVTFNITHTWDSDLDINLVAPNGNILNLVGARGGSGDNFTNTTISSASTTSLATGSAPFTGTFAADGNIAWGPNSYLSNVSSFSSLFSVPNGTWRLVMADFGAGDIGTLTSWSITINAVPPPTAGVWTPITDLFSDAAGTIPYVAGTAASTVYANPASTTTYSVTLTNSDTQKKTFSTGGPVTIPGIAPGSTSSGAGAPYPSTISVSGLPANAILKSVTVKGLRHSGPDDIDMLLQSPTGTNVVLMSDAGGLSDVTGLDYTFDDAAAALMADATLNPGGTYKPTNYGATDTYPAPINSITQANPALSMFSGDPNGAWKLYVRDQNSGDIGLISSWEIIFTIPDSVRCASAPGTVTVTVHTPVTFTTQPQSKTACQNSSVTFTATATGTIQTTQWQVSTDAGATWTNVAGATTTTLTLTNVQPSTPNHRYRLALTSAGCGTVYSDVVTLTVNPLPTVSLSLSPGGQTQLRPGMQTTVTVNSSPVGASYEWFVNGVAQPQITGSSYVVDAYHLGTYTIRVTDVNGCVSTTSGVTFTALPTTQLFIYPNPTTGAFYVTYYLRNAGLPVTINVIDMNGRRIVQRQETTTGPYTRFDFSSDKLAAGVYVIEFRDPSENLLAAGRLVVTR